MQDEFVVDEPNRRKWNRIKREFRRVGPLRVLDVFAFRAYYKLFLAGSDRQWIGETVEQMKSEYPPLPEDLPRLHTRTPNSSEAEAFIQDLRPDFMIARCKYILKESIFSIPGFGTFVMHPGVCPEYRNAHGCFWALANGDREKVGLTLLQADKGVDTGPVYGYYRYPFDETEESHIRIQHRCLIENLARVADKFREIYAGKAEVIDTSGRDSQTWGQPWLSKHLAWKYNARRRSDNE